MKNIMLAIMLFAGCNTAHAAYTDEQAVHALMGEARGSSYNEVFAHACAIRNRGSLRGVYGFNVPLDKLQRETKATWEKCRLAWLESASHNPYTFDHWAGSCDSKWLAKAKASGKFKNFIKIGNTTFFEEV